MHLIRALLAPLGTRCPGCGAWYDPSDLADWANRQH
ncbi:hypothetical protein ABH917_000057 [Thermobifida halotolerans]